MSLVLSQTKDLNLTQMLPAVNQQPKAAPARADRDLIQKDKSETPDSKNDFLKELTASEPAPKERNTESGKQKAKSTDPATPALDIASEAAFVAQQNALQQNLVQQSAPQVTPSTPEGLMAALNLPSQTPTLKQPLSIKPQVLFNQNPVLSFISGKLENIEPQSIPSLVAKNPFIQDALSSSDLGALFNDQSTLGVLAKKLELSDDALKALAQSGVQLTDLTTVRDVLKKLGLDPTRAMTELSLLSEKLPIEGVKSYVKRALTLQGVDHTKTPKAATPQQQKTPQTIETTATPIAEAGKVPEILPDHKRESIDTSKTPTLQNQEALQPTGDAKKPDLKVQDAQLEKVAPKKPENIVTPRNPQQQTQQFATPAFELPEVKSVQLDVPKAFVSEETWLQSFKNNFERNSTVVQDVSVKSVSTQDLKDFATTSDSILPETSNFTASPVAQTNLNGNFFDEQNSEEKSSEKEDDLIAKIQGAFSRSEAPVQADKPQFDVKIDQPQSVALKNLIQNIEQKVLQASTNSSQVGTMRVAIEDAGFGKVNLEIKLMGEKVDVKVFSDHPALKDSFESQSGLLKDSLLQQGLQLKSVSVTSHGNSFMQSNDQGRQDFSQQFNSHTNLFNQNQQSQADGREFRQNSTLFESGFDQMTKQMPRNMSSFMNGFSRPTQTHQFGSISVRV